MPNKPTYDTSFAVAEGFGSIRENYKRLIHFVCESAARYKRGATYGKFRTYIPKHLTSETSIKPSHDINSSLFVNALLWYVFTEAGIDKQMLDKRGHQYPSNGIYHIYQRSWTLKGMSLNKLGAFKRIHTACATLLDIEEHEWVRTMEQVIIPLFISACEKHNAPIYDPSTRTYCLENKQATIAWLVKLVQSILTPGKDGPMTSVILRGMDKTISEWDTVQPVENVSSTNSQTVADPAELIAKDTTQSCTAAKSLSEYTPKELFTYTLQALAVDGSRSEWKNAVREKLIIPLQRIYNSLSEQEQSVRSKKQSVEKLLETARLLESSMDSFRHLAAHISLQ